jgi:Region found in RelA / SpoT proteins
MAWTTPLYSHEDIEEAGRTLIADLASLEDRERALAITNNWRSSHAFPLNTFQMTLRRVVRRFDADPTVAQRTKRLPSIVSKLERLRWLSLAEMQDLGGCRAVLSDVGMAQAVADFYKHHSNIRHKLLREDDYIEQPKRSGYRGIHLIYGYESDRNPTFNGLKIEMQIRSRLQHAWATAVETVGAFTAQALKSSAGERDWLRFFALMSAALAAREEMPGVPGTPSDQRKLVDELTPLARKLRAIERLQGYGLALQVIEDVRDPTRFVILELDTVEQLLRLEEFDNALVAADAYAALERASVEIPGRDVVLVRVESLDALRRAYPNYFADTTVFVDAVTDVLAR